MVYSMDQTVHFPSFCKQLEKKNCFYVHLSPMLPLEFFFVYSIFLLIFNNKIEVALELLILRITIEHFHFPSHNLVT